MILLLYTMRSGFIYSSVVLWLIPVPVVFEPFNLKNKYACVVFKEIGYYGLFTLWQENEQDDGYQLDILILLE